MMSSDDGAGVANKPLEWTGHLQFSACALNCLPTTQGQRYTDDQWGEVTIAECDACFPVLQ
jgi:hypothetical protein